MYMDWWKLISPRSPISFKKGLNYINIIININYITSFNDILLNSKSKNQLFVFSLLIFSIFYAEEN